MPQSKDSVFLYEKDMELPTYPIGEPDRNPMFLEKRVYQGSSGKVYPLPVIDRIHDDKIMKKYRMVILENEYLEIWVLPELGGRVHRALDKTNGFDFVYYNHVVKPALVGLAGPWISGGIEFNWPQHHRPGTYLPVEYALQDNEDGSKSVVVGETDVMYGTKATARLTLHPGKAFLQIDVRLYNGTPEPQTILWWANPAFPANENTQSVFPPDVCAVMDHGKRDVSKFPIADGTYYKVDYSAGVDISRFRNIPVPTSYMAYHSEFDFVGGYDHGRHAGLLHVADRHVSPGKKQWTWGNGEFGRAWDRNLTDEDGSYIELMTGVFTDNQPDFTWIAPYEEKTFTQYFLPYKELAMVKNATADAAVSLEAKAGQAQVRAYATALHKSARIVLTSKSRIYLDCTGRLSPNDIFQTTCPIDAQESPQDLELSVYDEAGALLVSYRPVADAQEPVPEPAKAIPAPQELPTNEALYLAGLHLEQYRHASREPDGYYLEGLRRDPSDIRLNNAYGRLLRRRGLFTSSEAYFRAAVASATRHNPNPYDGEPHYNLGLSLYWQERYDEAYDAFYKSVWNAAQQGSGYFWLARLSARAGRWQQALEHVRKSLVHNGGNSKALSLQSSILRRLDRHDEARQAAGRALEADALDFGAHNERYLLEKAQGSAAGATTGIELKLAELMRDDAKNYLALSSDYANAGMYEEATDVLLRLVARVPAENVSPMVFYHLGWYAHKAGNGKAGEAYFLKAARANAAYCFPNRQEDILALQCSQSANSGDAKAFYYLGNLWYDRRQTDEAVACWERSAALDDSFPTVHRNLSLVYYNKLGQPDKAKAALEKAFALDQTDARVFLELDELCKKTGVSPGERLKNMQAHMELVERRDDLYTEYVTVLITCRRFAEAYALIMGRRFHPWEGGEGKITRQYVYALTEIGKQHLAQGRFAQAAEALEKAFVYPENLGEGKLFGAQENALNFYLGLAYRGLGRDAQAQERLRLASQGLWEPASAMFYNDQPPETIFYQGLALQALGEQEAAAQRFETLLRYGQEHLTDKVEIDYFAVSLPDFLIFDDDLDRRNAVHCHYLMGLGHLGRNEQKAAGREFAAALQLDASHQGALTHGRLAQEKLIRN